MQAMNYHYLILATLHLLVSSVHNLHVAITVQVVQCSYKMWVSSGANPDPKLPLVSLAHMVKCDIFCRIQVTFFYAHCSFAQAETQCILTYLLQCNS